MHWSAVQSEKAMKSKDTLRGTAGLLEPSKQQASNNGWAFKAVGWTQRLILSRRLAQPTNQRRIREVNIANGKDDFGLSRLGNGTLLGHTLSKRSITPVKCPRVMQAPAVNRARSKCSSTLMDTPLSSAANVYVCSSHAHDHVALVINGSIMLFATIL